MSSVDGGPSRTVRRSDPDRRGRIIDACLDVIAENGVAGASHRRIAAAADVPLGSMTYHFTGMEDLLHEAFTRFADTVADQTDRRITTATTPSEAQEAVIDVITRDVFGSQRDLVITHELYTLAARDPAFRDITTTWMMRSRTALERWFDPATARIIDALIEGLTIHRALDTGSVDDTLTAEAIRRILTQEHPTLSSSSSSSSSPNESTSYVAATHDPGQAL